MSRLLSPKRVLLKLSGETLVGPLSFGIDANSCRKLAQDIKALCDSGLEVGIVIGGGNIFRGLSLTENGMSATPADQIGMLATLMNGLALQQALEILNCPALVMSALECPRVAEPYNWRKALEALKNKIVVLFVGGTGNPYFTTDTAAALRASEIHADVLLKATKVDGIYSKDPLKNKDAVKYDQISYSQILAEKLEIMDATAIALCRKSRIPIFVFNMQSLSKQSITKIIAHEGTLVTGE